MATVNLSPVFNAYQGFTSGGTPLNGGLIYTYQAGTSTPAATYTTNVGNVANANPIVLGSDGRPPNEVWLIQGQGYLFVLKDSAGNQLGSYDNISAPDGNVLTLLADPTNAANGDALIAVKSTLTSGVARTQHDKNAETISIADFLPPGYVTDGSVDYTTYVQAFFTACATNHKRGLLLPIDIQISSQISLTSGSNLSNFEICGESSDGALPSNGAYGCRFLWSGAGGTAFYLNNVRDAKLSGIFVMPKGANNLAVALDIDGANSTNLDIGIVAVNGSGTLGTGIRVANTSTSGNDLHDFRRCYVSGATTGFDVRNGQSKLHRLYGCTFAFCTTGVNQLDGSFTLYNPNFSHNGVDIALATAADTFSIHSAQSELSGRFLYAPNQQSAGSVINVFGGRIRTDAGYLNGDGKYIVSSAGGPLNLIGVDFASGNYVANWRIAAFNNSAPNADGTVNALGCIFPNSTVWDSTTLPSTVRALLNCRVINSDGTQSPKSSTNFPYTALSTGIPFVMASSGTMGNNGALSGLTAVAATYPAAYVYLPANAISAGSAAGWYYAVFSSTTAATVYNNTYTSGVPTVPGSPTAFATTGPGAYTQTTGVYIPGPQMLLTGNAMGLNGNLRWDLQQTNNNSGNGKFFGFYASASVALGTRLATFTSTTNTFGQIMADTFINSTLATQYTSGISSAGVTPVAANRTTVNFASDDYLQFALQLATATDTATLEGCAITVSP